MKRFSLLFLTLYQIQTEKQPTLQQKQNIKE
jgi:hypothetical protein